MRKLIYMMVLAFALIITGCSNEVSESNPNTILYEGIETYETFFSFQDVVCNSDVAVVGEYIETIKHDNYIEQKFSVKDVLYGNVSDNEIYLYSNIGTGHILEIDYTYELGANKYETDTEYILVMELSQSVMYEHDRYMVATDVLLCEETNEYSMYSQAIDFPDDMTVKEYIISMHQSDNHTEKTNGVATTYESDMEEMLYMSEYVGTIEILELVSEGKVHNGNTYRCSIEELYKGTNPNTYDDGTILITILKNTVEIDKCYVVGFSPVNEGSLIYSQSTTSSVYEISDELLTEINSRLKR